MDAHWALFPEQQLHLSPQAGFHLQTLTAGLTITACLWPGCSKYVQDPCLAKAGNSRQGAPGPPEVEKGQLCPSDDTQVSPSKATG